MTSRRLALLALTALALPACGKFDRLRDDEKVTTVQLGSSRSGPHIEAPQNGGVMIWGVSAAQKVAIAMPNESTDVTKTLRNGDWTFYSVGWTGPSPFQGTPSCGVVQQTLNGTDATVNIAISSVGCANPAFGVSGAPKALRFVTCNSVAGITAGGQDCESVLRGDLNSFRVSYEAYDPIPADAIPTAPSPVRSTCFSTGGTASYVATTPQAFPDGGLGFSPMSVSIEAFGTNDCSGTMVQRYAFGKGLRNGITNGAPPALNLFSSSTTDLYLQHGPVPAPSISGVNPPTAGWGGHRTLLVTGANFDAGSTVAVGGVTCPLITAPTTSLIQCTIPAFPAKGPQNVRVTRGDGQYADLPGGINYVEDGFGNGAAGSFTISTSITDPSAVNTWGVRPFHSYRNVKSINGTLVELSSSFTTSDFAVGDDVLWHVSGANTTTSCDSSSLVPGAFGYSKITAVDLSTSKVTLADIITSTPNNTAIGQTNRTTVQTFCDIQLVRFPAFENLTIDGNTSPVIYPTPFSYSTGYGGILVLKASGTLTITGAGVPTIAGFNSGYPKGLGNASMGYPGAGQFGSPWTVDTTANGLGGGGGGSTVGAGGGAGNGALGGAGGGGSNGGLLPTTCDPFANCALFGGGGGGGTSAGYDGESGAGIVLVSARTVDSSTTYASFSVRGNAAANPGTGAGGGGTLLLQYASYGGISPNVGAGGYAGGGFSAAYGGGGSGGGLVSFVHCAGGSTFSTTLSGGVGGTGTTTSGLTGADGHSQDHPVSSGTGFCP